MSQLTDTDLALLRLPARIPGLLRRCTPVVLRWKVKGISEKHPLVWRRGAWFPGGPKADEGLVCWDKWCGEERAERRVYAGNLMVDLSDPTGEMHAAWWLAERQCPGSAPGSAFWYGFDEGIERGPDGSPLANHWTLIVGAGNWISDEDAFPAEVWDAMFAMRNDPRTLPDGRHYAHVLALVLVCLHTAGETERLAEVLAALEER